MTALDRFLEGLRGYPKEWNTQDLTKWEAAHVDPNGDVWVVTPPQGVGWQLWAPGSKGDDGYYADRAGRHGPDTTDRMYRLAEVADWLYPWVQQVTGRRVTAAVEGWGLYGPRGEYREPVIYLRVA